MTKNQVFTLSHTNISQYRPSETTPNCSNEIKLCWRLEVAAVAVGASTQSDRVNVAIGVKFLLDW